MIKESDHTPERLVDLPRVSIRARSAQEYRRYFGEDAVFCYFESPKNELLFEKICEKQDSNEPLLALPSGYESTSMNDRLLGLAEVGAILPADNLEARADTHNKTLENYIKLALLTAGDLDTVTVYLSVISARLCLEPENVAFAQQALHIWAPLAGVVGLYTVKSQLENMAFAALKPEEYRKIVDTLSELLKHDDSGDKSALLREAEGLERVISDELYGLGTTITVSVRQKEPYSIWQKQQLGKVDVSDYLGVRIIVSQIDENKEHAVDVCFEVERILQEIYGDAVIQRKRKNYITYPKHNGYQSLHLTTGVSPRDFGPGVVVEIQIRTQEMHEHVETDKQLYQQYGARRPTPGRRASEHVKKKSHKIYEWRSIAMVDIMDTGVIDRRAIVGENGILVFNKDGNLFIVEKGHTALDGAFRIHSEYASRTQRICFLKNGVAHIVKFDHELEEGDCIDLVYAPKGQPTWKDDWKFSVNSDIARDWLRKAVKKRDAEVYILRGIQKVAEEMRRQKWRIRPIDLLSAEQKQQIATDKGFKDFEMLLREIGAGTTGAGKIAQILNGIPLSKNEKEPEAGSVYLPGLSSDLNLPIHYAGCCDGAHATEMSATWSKRLGSLNVHDSECRGVRELGELNPDLIFSVLRA